MQEMQERQVRFLGQEDLSEEEMAAHSSILAWRILWTEEPGGLQSMGCKEPDLTEHACMVRFKQANEVAKTVRAALQGHLKSVPAVMNMCCLLVRAAGGLAFFLLPSPLSFCKKELAPIPPGLPQDPLSTLSGCYEWDCAHPSPLPGLSQEMG